MYKLCIQIKETIYFPWIPWARRPIHTWVSTLAGEYLSISEWIVEAETGVDCVRCELHRTQQSNNQILLFYFILIILIILTCQLKERKIMFSTMNCIAPRWRVSSVPVESLCVRCPSTIYVHISTSLWGWAPKPAKISVSVVLYYIYRYIK